MHRQLTFLDQGFLQLESATNPLHIGLVQRYRLSEAEKSGFIDKSLDFFRRQLVSHFPFSHILETGGRAGSLVWSHKPDLDWGYHIRRKNLPGADEEELMRTIAKLHEKQMSRRQPLWQIYSLETGENDTVIFYFKIHHACMDGIGGMRLMQTFLSSSPGEMTSQSEPPKPGEANGSHHESNLLTRAGKILSDEFQAVKELVGTWLKHRNETDHKSRLLPLPFSAPKVKFNSSTCRRRSLAVRNYSVSELKRLRRNGSTVNDIVLSLCAGALRRFLAARGELPADPLIAFVPVSVRSAHDKKEGGNEIGFILVNLATHLADPLERLQLITASTRAGKEQLSHMPNDAIRRHSEMIFAIAGMSYADFLLQYLPPVFNVVISNVPAARKTLYFDGVALEAVYPVSVLFTGQGLNITLMTYGDNLQFGLISCDSLISDPDEIAVALDASLDELRSALANSV